MFDHKLLTSALGVLGCQKLGKLEYSIPSECPNLQWTLAFRLLGVYRWEIDGSVRYSHREGSLFSQRCLCEFAGDWWRNMLESHPKLGGGLGFPIANLAPWSAMHSLNIKDFTAEESASRVAADVKQYVLPFVASVTSEQQYLKLLLSDGKPMQWHSCQPLQRFAEAAWLCKRLAGSLEAALSILPREQKFMQGQLNGYDINRFVERVIHSLSQNDAQPLGQPDRLSAARP